MILTQHGIDSFLTKVGPDGLVSLFYGDFYDGNYHERYRHPYLTQRTDKTNSTFGITTSRIETTPLGDIPVFRHGDPNSSYSFYIHFRNHEVKIGDFTIEFWAYYNPFGERTGIERIRIIENYEYNATFGPYGRGGYYNPGRITGQNEGNENIPNDTWQHLEFDFDFSEKKIYMYRNGILFFTRTNIGDYLQNSPASSVYKHVTIFNDSRSHPNAKFTQIAFWNKKMNGQCYSIGLYHDGDKFLI